MLAKKDARFKGKYGRYQVDFEDESAEVNILTARLTMDEMDELVQELYDVKFEMLKGGITGGRVYPALAQAAE